MTGYRRSRELVLAALDGGVPKSCREIVGATGLSMSMVYAAVSLAWRRGLVLRTVDPLYEFEKVFKGRGGLSRHMRPFHLYVLKPEGMDSIEVDGRRFVGFSEELLDPRGGGGASKAGRILDLLRENSERAMFSTEIVEELREHGVRVRDVMSNVRRFERQGLVYVRGYMTDERQTPFKKGFLITCLDLDKPRELAISEAVKRTERALENGVEGSSLMERVHRIRDIVLEHSQLRNLVSYTYLENKLGATPDQVRRAVMRALQLYPDLREVKLFDAYRYYYHGSMAEEDLKAAIQMKMNYVRMSKGKDQRVGHNWEAVAEWFIDRFTTGARFWTQQHRTKRMDSRMITLHLLKGVGGRRRAAEVDRVWEVTPGIFASPITYVLSCKWGLVTKGHVDDFLEVLRWSKDFGVDTPDGREVKQGVLGVFAASAFNPKERVQLKDETLISLPQYAARRQLQLVTGADFNVKLRERGVEKSVTVQKICKLSRNEEEVRRTLDSIWKQPEKADSTLAELQGNNQELYRFEEMLESRSESGSSTGDG